MTKVSIVIPCRNEAPFIGKCLKAIQKSTLDELTEIQIFVVDGMSDDGTRTEVEKFATEDSRIHLIDNTKQVTPFAFNLGITAGGRVDFVQIIGARHIISENYLQKSIEILSNDSTIWCVGGKLKNQYINEDGRIIALAMGSSFGMGFGNFRTLNSSMFTDTVTSPMYPYWVFDEIGFFDEALIRNQDDDFNYRIKKANGKIWFENSIQLSYYVRGSYKQLWRQFFQYGYWKVFVNKKHKINTTYRQLIPPLFVFGLGMILLSYIFGTKVMAIFSLPLALYLLILILLSSTMSKKVADFVRLIMVFPILHISYGVGYWKGIIDFLVLHKKPSDHQKRMSR